MKSRSTKMEKTSIFLVLQAKGQAIYWYSHFKLSTILRTVHQDLQTVVKYKRPTEWRVNQYTSVITQDKGITQSQEFRAGQETVSLDKSNYTLGVAWKIKIGT